MPSPRESRAALKLLTGEAVSYAQDLVSRFKGSPDLRRAALLESVPGVVDYYSDGSSALAADFYQERRELAGVTSLYAVQPVVSDRVVKIRTGVAWAADPLFGTQIDDAALLLVASRIGDVVQLETARPYRDTILGNQSNDAASVGWRRITAGGCPLCRMLADRGAVYKQDTARFATHPNCNCAAEPVFTGQETGPEASVLQYRASARSRTPKQRAELRSYLESFY